MRGSGMLTVLAGMLALAGAVLADTTLLDANFDDKTVGAPIGTGGAKQGEPVDIQAFLDAVVRATGQEYHLQFIFDMHGDIYCVYHDGRPLVEDRAHGITGIDIGRFIVSIGQTSPVGTSATIDNLRIDVTSSTATRSASLGEVKKKY